MFAVLLAIAALGGGAASQDAQATSPGGVGTLAFVSPIGIGLFNGPWHLFMANADGSGAVDRTPGFADTPVALAWSPDGTRLAFTAFEGTFFDIDEEDPLTRWLLYVMNADGSGLHQVAAFESELPAPSWSADGTEIAYTAHVHEDMQIFAAKADGSSTRQITNLRGAALGGTSWSPDGTQIAFGADMAPSDDESHWSLWIVGADGLDLHQLNPAEITLTDWSPNGASIASSENAGLAVLAADGSSKQILIQNTEPEFDEYESETFVYLGPGWSPDGARIAFSSNRWSENPTVGAVNADGTCPTQIIARASFSPAWRPVPGGPATGPMHCADLAVTEASAPHIVGIKRPFTLTDRVVNQGNLPAADAHLTHTLPPGLVPHSASTTAGSCTIRARSVDCTLGTLGPGVEARVDIVVHASRRRVGDGLVVAASATADPDSTDDLEISVSPRICSVFGTPGNDRLRGTRRGDVICGLGGNDRIDARGGDDYVIAGLGRDVVLGGEGDDTLEGGGGGDTLDGGPGHDWIVGGPGSDRLYGRDGRDFFIARDRFKDLIRGGSEVDIALDADRFDLILGVEIGEGGTGTARTGLRALIERLRD